MHYSRMANGFKIDLRLDSGKEVKYMDSCDSADRRRAEIWPVLDDSQGGAKAC